MKNIQERTFEDNKALAEFLATGINRSQIVSLGFNAKGGAHVVYTEGVMTVEEKLKVDAGIFGNYAYLAGVQIANGQVILEGPSHIIQIKAYGQFVKTIVSWLIDGDYKDVYMASPPEQPVQSWIISSTKIIDAEPISIIGYGRPSFYANGIVAFGQSDGRLYFSQTTVIKPDTMWHLIYVDPDGAKIKYLSRIKPSGIVYLTTVTLTGTSIDAVPLSPLTEEGIDLTKFRAERTASMTMSQPDALLDIIDEESATGAFMPQLPGRGYALEFNSGMPRPIIDASCC